MTWNTPPEVVHHIENYLIKDKFTLDLCADEENSITPNWIDDELNIFSNDALAEISQKDVCFMNPPYTKCDNHTLGDFVRRAKEIHDISHAKIVLLIPAQSIGTTYWKKCVGIKPTDLKQNHVTVYFFPYRIAFVDQETGDQSGTPFSPSVVIMYEAKQC